MHPIHKIQLAVFGTCAIGIIALEIYDGVVTDKKNDDIKSRNEMRRMIVEERDPCKDLDSRIASREFWNLVIPEFYPSRD